MSPLAPALSGLFTAYEKARAEVGARALVPLEEFSWSTKSCRYCGKVWRHWHGSKIDGHARCVVTPAFERLLLETFESNPGLSYKLVAEVLDVSIAVVRAWVTDALHARGKGTP